MAQTYFAYGMTLRSDFELPLPRASRTGRPAWCVRVRAGPVVRRPDLACGFGDIRYCCTDSLTHVDVPWAARYEVRGDSTLTVEPVASASDEVIGLYLAGFVLPLLLRSRPVVTLHGSAVSAHGESIAIVGAQGSGKSTTAAALSQKGYQVLCDDVVPVAEGPIVMPGLPSPKLLADAYRRLVGDPNAARDLFDGVDKYRLASDAPVEPARLAGIVLLEVGSVSYLVREGLRGAGKIAAIVSHVAVAVSKQDAAEQLVRCSQWLAATPSYRIVRPIRSDTLDDVVSAVLSLKTGGSV